MADLSDWFKVKVDDLKKSIPQEVTFLFPENKPIQEAAREIVENINENEQIPESSNLLSDKNSQARNPERNSQTGNSPLSKGNTPFSNLSGPTALKQLGAQQKKFSSSALKGETYNTPKSEEAGEKSESRRSEESIGTNQVLNQKDFSVAEVGALSLSTYQWEWAPYINAMKNKLQTVWVTPPAYNMLGLIHGYTVINFTITREGKLLEMKVLYHEGHESLEFSSTEAINALFPFLPLPQNFPEKTLTITAKLWYPDLRQRR